MLAMILFVCLLFNLARSDGNDDVCTVPTTYYSREKLRSLLPVPFKYIGSVSANATYYINIGAADEPPNWFLATNLLGLSVQVYNSGIGTINGSFYLNFSGSLVLVASWYFNLDTYDKKLTSYNTYCTSSLTGTIGYIRSDITANNLFTNVYTINKAFGNSGVFNLGDAQAMEWFIFTNNQVSFNCLTTMNVTTGLLATQICFRYQQISSKRDSFQNIGPSELADYPIDDPFVTNIGHLSIPKSLIEKDKQKYFNFVRKLKSN